MIHKPIIKLELQTKRLLSLTSSHFVNSYNNNNHLVHSINYQPNNLKRVSIKIKTKNIDKFLKS